MFISFLSRTKFYLKEINWPDHKGCQNYWDFTAIEARWRSTWNIGWPLTTAAQEQTAWTLGDKNQKSGINGEDCQRVQRIQKPQLEGVTSKNYIEKVDHAQEKIFEAEVKLQEMVTERHSKGVKWLVILVGKT